MSRYTPPGQCDCVPCEVCGGCHERHDITGLSIYRDTPTGEDAADTT